MGRGNDHGRRDVGGRLMFWTIVALAYIVAVVLILSLFSINKPEDEE
jgi:hypothetical protein